MRAGGPLCSSIIGLPPSIAGLRIESVYAPADCPYDHGESPQNADIPASLAAPARDLLPSRYLKSAARESEPVPSAPHGNPPEHLPMVVVPSIADSDAVAACGRGDWRPGAKGTTLGRTMPPFISLTSPPGDPT